MISTAWNLMTSLKMNLFSYAYSIPMRQLPSRRLLHFIIVVCSRNAAGSPTVRNGDFSGHFSPSSRFRSRHELPAFRGRMVVYQGCTIVQASINAMLTFCGSALAAAGIVWGILEIIFFAATRLYLVPRMNRLESPPEVSICDAN